MRLYFRPVIGMVIALLMATAALGPAAYAQGSSVYLATYIEVMPNAVAPGIALLKQYRDASSKEDGNLRVKALAEIERPNRFVRRSLARQGGARSASPKRGHISVR